MKHWKTALVLAALGAMGPFSVDTYFPSFPSIAAHFGVRPIDVQATLTCYLVALAAMSLFHGAVSDSFGRRPVILVCLAVYSLTAFACPFVPSFGGLLFLRVIQGLSAGTGMIVGRAVIRDRFEGAEAHRFMAQVTVVSCLAPAIAPILGGWLHVWFGWRSPFLFLGLLGTALFWTCLKWLPESLPPQARQSFHPAALTRSYCQVLRHPPFLALALALSLSGGGFLIYVATAPDMVLNVLRLSPTQFGWLFVPIVLGLLLGSGITAHLSGRARPHLLLRWAFALMGGASLLNCVYNVFCSPHIPWAVIPLFLYALGLSLFAPIGTVLCLDLFPEKRGLVSSLQGFVQLLLFALLSGGAARLVYGSGLKHALAMAIMLLVTWGCWRVYRLFKPLYPPGVPD
jgi:MFS transporter, DHA1 family, multidrug resistance protein